MTQEESPPPGDGWRQMKIKAMLPYFGGKRNLAPIIVKLLGRHHFYWEPFCGSMAVLFAKEPCRMETVNDLYGDLINLARILKNEDSAFSLYEKLQRTLMHECLFMEAAANCRVRGYYQPVEEPDLGRAYDFFVASWLGRNGLVGEKSYNWTYCARYTPNGGHSGKRWRSVIESIPAWHKRLLQVTILYKDAFEVISKIHDSVNTAIYVDPPYIEKNGSYIHDLASGEHAKLATELARFRRARVVLSLYEHPSIAEWYRGWFTIKIDVSKAIANSNKAETNKPRATEVLLCNQPIDAGQQALFE